MSRIITDYEAYLFGEGHWLQAWEKMGARPAVVEGRAGYSFVVWAPNARAVSVVGDFNLWDGRGHVLKSLGASGLWETFVPGLAAGSNYKFEIHPQYGAPFTKCDPYGLRMERPPRTASVTSHLGEYEWRDAAWIADRQERGTVLDGAMSVYEVHAGSWRRNPLESFRSLTWRELALELVPYVSEMGFTHIELMPVM